jgi:copper(I)-binding protein
VRRLISSIAVLSLVVAGCGGDDGVSVEKPWARSSPSMANAGAVYMSLESGTDDRLVGVSVPTDIAATAEIHETTMVDDAMTMQEVGEIELPAGTTVSLEPGGYHIMLLDIPEPLVTGEKFDVTLTFENAGDKVVEVEVRDDEP